MALNGSAMIVNKARKPLLKGILTYAVSTNGNIFVKLITITLNS